MGQAFAVAQAGGLRAEGLKVIADHLVQHALRGRPRLICRRWTDHAAPRRTRDATRREAGSLSKIADQVR
jgi:hypothetical protein